MAEGTVAILGGRGMLGSDLALECQQQGINFHVFDLPDFDITNTKQLESVIKQTECIINCAAYTDVDKAESHYDWAYKVNAQAVGELGILAKKAKKWILHISTDFVFDGTLDRPYLETDLPNPINAYGKTKLAGEQLLIESNCRNCIMRIEWIYGLHGKNFITELIKRAKENRKLKVADDQIGSPTATTQVAKVICKLLKKKPEGLFHFANGGYANRFEEAKFVLKKLDMYVDIDRCKTKDLTSTADRPLNSRFDCSKIKKLLNETIEPWQGPLEKFLKQL
ncbi:MAG: dTDP-4-dehydrorhamnose reductase [Planctomycetota bacterium]|jgi:dTDP-4-dehydrorhamnose reductase